MDHWRWEARVESIADCRPNFALLTLRDPTERDVRRCPILHDRPTLMPEPRATCTEHIHFLLLPEFSAIGFMSAVEPLRVANRFGAQRRTAMDGDGTAHGASEPLYAWHILSAGGMPVSASNGISLNAERSFGDVEGIRTLFIVAGFNPLAAYTRELGNWLRQLDRAGVTLGGIDTGSFVLAEAGLFDTQRVTLHWEAASAFSERYPSLPVSGELFEIDGPRITCAGGTASIDMMLDLIGRKHGHALAAAVSEQFVIGRIRDRSDHQRMEIAARYGIHNSKLIQVISVMEQHMEETLSPDALADAIGVTRRHLERLFCGVLKDTPTHFYLQLRLARARELLRQTDLSITSICVACGFESPSHFSRSYRARYGTTPRDDRAAA
jgi:AraC family carnitine catabolism transcriptional activator